MPDRIVFVNDLPYTTREPAPLDALRNTLAFSADDWGASRAMAWVWGIVLGWDDDAIDELAARHGWPDEVVAHLRDLHRKFDAIGGGPSD